MKKSLTGPLARPWAMLNQWLFQTPERSLDQAYDAALTIRSLEEKHFGGGKIDYTSPERSERVNAYFKSELKRNLNIVKLRLAEFKTSRSFLSFSDKKLLGVNGATESLQEGVDPFDPDEAVSAIVEKLQFIDSVVLKYDRLAKSQSLVPVQPANAADPARDGAPQATGPAYPQELELAESAEAMSDKTGFLPRSILGTIDRVRKELDPNAEEQLIRSFRSSKSKTIVSLRFILLIILIPLLAQQVSKKFLVGPIVDHLRSPSEGVFLNVQMEEEALLELQRFEEELRFRSLLTGSQKLSEEEMIPLLKDKAREIEAEYRQRGSNAIKNIFSDLIALIAFTLVLVLSRREVAILKSFMDDIVYGLSDSAKAFIIILFTDIFVGFHSPHGWEVVLANIARHFGLPESRDFIFLFIATFPVILDTVFKYWIFRYLNRVSPSAVATYRNMNE
ncbi:proton extrusion protein PcxA [Trichothermofontia sp.]